MSESIHLFDSAPAAPTPAAVELFDPPMCCPTGVCGPALDQTLLDVNDMILALKAEGVTVSRYQMTSHPQAFLSNNAVMQLMRERELDALPVAVVEGSVIKVGAYPTLEEIRNALTGVSA